MENHKISDVTREKYEDAVVSAFMEQYAAALETGIDREMEVCQQNEFPAELDKRCMELIQREHAKKKRQAWSKQVLRGCRSAAIFAVALLAVCSVLFVTVEAFRLPILNFFIEKADSYWELSGVPNADKIPDVFNPEHPLDGIIPEEFDLVNLNGTWEEGIINAEYSNGNNAVINFTVFPTHGKTQVDFEDADAVPCKVHGNDALKSVEDGFVRITWLDVENEKTFTLCAINVSVEMVERYAELLAEQVKQ